MMRTTDTAIVLRRAPSGESSLALVLLCRASGRVAAIAKGVRTAPGKAGVAAALDLLHEVEVVLSPSRRGGRVWVQDAVLLESFRGLQADYGRFELACHFASLVALCLDEGHPAPAVYDLLRLGLGHLETHAASLRVMLRFEWRLLDLLGLQPGNEAPSAAQFAAIFDHNFHGLPAGRAKLLAALTRRSAT